MRPVWPLMIRVLGAMKPEKAARSSIFLASSAEVEGVTGTYFDTKGRKARWHRDMVDPQRRKTIWELSERLSGVRADELLGAVQAMGRAASAAL